MVWHRRVVVGVFHPTGLSPRDWLHLRQVTRALVMVSVPPWEAGVMWSGSGLFGWSVVSHARVVPQSGQLVCPAALARWRTRVRHFLWRVVPVRDAVMGVSLVGGLVFFLLWCVSLLVCFCNTCSTRYATLESSPQNTNWKAG